MHYFNIECQLTKGFSVTIKKGAKNNPRALHNPYPLPARPRIKTAWSMVTVRTRWLIIEGWCNIRRYCVVYRSSYFCLRKQTCSSRAVCKVGRQSSCCKHHRLQGICHWLPLTRPKIKIP